MRSLSMTPAAAAVGCGPVDAGRADWMDASNVMPEGACWALSWPSSLVAASRESSSEGLIPLSVALPCQLVLVGGLDAALFHCPCACMWPPAPVAASDSTVHWPCRNTNLASRLRTGRCCWFQGPL